jgi:uroporphyrinogen-III synthase
VDVVDAYQTRTATPDAAALEAAAGADIITFTSSSTVDRFLEMAGPARVPAFVACIGPITAATALDHGLSVDVVAEVHSIDGLVDAIVGAIVGER